MNKFELPLLIFETFIKLIAKILYFERLFMQLKNLIYHYYIVPLQTKI